MAEMIGDLIFTPGEDEPADSMSLIGMRAVVTPAGFEPVGVLEVHGIMRVA